MMRARRLSVFSVVLFGVLLISPACGRRVGSTMSLVVAGSSGEAQGEPGSGWRSCSKSKM